MSNRKKKINHDQHIGFEREKLFHAILAEALEGNPAIRVSDVKAIIRQITPEFFVDLFSPRPCRRQLRYRGPAPNNGSIENSPLCPGQVYRSVDFTGATYALEDLAPTGGDRQRFDYRCFDWID